MARDPCLKGLVHHTYNINKSSIYPIDPEPARSSSGRGAGVTVVDVAAPNQRGICSSAGY
eukprot:1187970-Prorocentrum_minimum.AAC.1